MIKNLYILLFSLLTCSFFTSCDGDNDTLQDTILGRWYVNAVSHAGYNMYSGYDPIAEDYFINFFYGDYMPFLKGDQLEFGNFNMRRAGFNGTGDQYTYNIYRSTLELNNSYRVSYNILAWSHEQIILCFDKNSLLDYITSEMNYAQTAEHYQQLAYIRDQVIHYVSDFYIEYVLTRNIPTVSQIISGNYYGKLSDGSGPLFNNDWVSASLYRQGPESFNFVLNDQISLSNGPVQGPPFTLQVPATWVGYGNLTGQIVFEGSSITDHYAYGRIEVYITGQSLDSQTLDIDIEIRNNGLIYTLYFRQGIRYLLEPQILYRSRGQSQAQERQVIPLKPSAPQETPRTAQKR